MPRLVGLVLRWSLLPFLLLLAQALAAEFWHALRAQGLGAAWALRPLALWLCAGFGFRLIFAWILRRFGRDDPFEFLDTLEHELTHALVGYATFCPPESLTASLKDGGEVQLRGSNPLAALAPYYLPLWCLLTVGLGAVVRPDLQGAWNHALFCLLGAFAYRLAREYRWRQTDLHVYGFLFSTAAVCILLFLSLSLILQVRGLLPWRWVGAAGIRAWHTLPALRVWAERRLGPAP